MDPLESFIRTRCESHPAATMPLADFSRAYRAQLPPDLRAAWKRGRIIARLVELGYEVGTLEKTYFITGLAAGHWTVAGGRLQLV